MSHYDAERLYALLPAVYRERDAEAGYPLKALVALLAREARIVERDVARLYENAFIETCDEWVVPYLADLIAVPPLPSGELRRDEVANTLGFRRRKGTAAVLEQLAADATGWSSRVVEPFRLLATTQFLDHPRPRNHRTPDLRDAARLERLDGPFDDVAHTADVRRIATRQGHHNLSQAGLWVWRLEAFPLHLVEPHVVDAASGRYTFRPLGIDAPLFHHPLTEAAPSQIAGEAHVPEPIRRRQLATDLARGGGRYTGAGRSFAFYELQGGEWKLVAKPIHAADLSDWSRPLPPEVIAVDPVLGRFVFNSADPPPATLRVSFHHGGSSALGGGQYPRDPGGAGGVEPPAAVVGDPNDPRIEGTPYPTLAEALLAIGSGWEAGATRVIEFRDSRTYAEALDPIAVPDNARLVIRAAPQERPLLRLTNELTVDAGEGSGLTLDGLVIAGEKVRIDGALNRLTIRHSTLVPGHDLAPDGTPTALGAPSLELLSDTAEAEIRSSIVGPLWIAGEAEITLEDAILDAGDGAASAYSGPGGSGFGGALRALRTTVVGTVDTRAVLRGENSLFLGVVKAERRQDGCVRYSWVAPGSRVPRRFRCQPQLPPDAGADERERLLARLAPRFVTLRYGRPAYAQLDWRGPSEILRGADDGSEMGAFSGLQQPQREDGLRQRLDDYLPVGLEAGIFFAT